MPHKIRGKQVVLASEKQAEAIFTARRVNSTPKFVALISFFHAEEPTASASRLSTRLERPRSRIPTSASGIENEWCLGRVPLPIKYLRISGNAWRAIVISFFFNQF